MQNDYVMRMIEQFAKVLAHILGLRKAGKSDEVIHIVNTTVKSLLGLDPELVAKLSPKGVLSMLSSGAGFDVERAVILAELLTEQANSLELVDQSGEAHSARLKALYLYLESYLTEHGRPLVMEKVEEASGVASSLDPAIIDTLEIHHMKALVEIYLHAGYFSKCDDLIFNLLKNHQYNNDILCWGIELYNKLLLVPPERLQSGNLPLAEVHESIAELEKHRS